MFDLIIRGDQVVTSEGTGRWDICIRGETIAAIATPGTFGDEQAGRVIDATGKIVIPGGIDPHIHSLWHIPALEEGGEASMTDGPDTVSRAAIHGGTTTLLDFATWQPGDPGRLPIDQDLHHRHHAIAPGPQDHAWPYLGDLQDPEARGRDRRHSCRG